MSPIRDSSYFEEGILNPAAIESRKRRLGHNDRCWYGSSKKYKVCHLDREKQKPPRAWEADAAIHARDTYSPRKTASRENH